MGVFKKKPGKQQQPRKHVPKEPRRPRTPGKGPKPKGVITNTGKKPEKGVASSLGIGSMMGSGIGAAANAGESSDKLKRAASGFNFGAAGNTGSGPGETSGGDTRADDQPGTAGPGATDPGTSETPKDKTMTYVLIGVAVLVVIVVIVMMTKKKK